MKKVLKFLMTIILVVNLTSCGGGTDKKTEANNSEKENTKAEVQGKSEKETNKSVWQKVGVKDEFGDIIEGESSIMANFEGTMSNTAVSNEDLTVAMQVVEDSTIYSSFYEYSREPQAQLPDSKYLTIKVKVSNGEVLEVEQFLYGNMMIDNDKELLKILLSQDKPVKVIADISRADKYANGVYNFEIDPNGLKDVLD